MSSWSTVITDTVVGGPPDTLTVHKAQIYIDIEDDSEPNHFAFRSSPIYRLDLGALPDYHTLSSPFAYDVANIRSLIHREGNRFNTNNGTYLNAISDAKLTGNIRNYTITADATYNFAATSEQWIVEVYVNGRTFIGKDFLGNEYHPAVPITIPASVLSSCATHFAEIWTAPPTHVFISAYNPGITENYLPYRTIGFGRYVEACPNTLHPITEYNTHVVAPDSDPSESTYQVACNADGCYLAYGPSDIALSDKTYYEVNVGWRYGLWSYSTSATPPPDETVSISWYDAGMNLIRTDTQNFAYTLKATYLSYYAYAVEIDAVFTPPTNASYHTMDRVWRHHPGMRNEVCHGANGLWLPGMYRKTM